MSNDDNLLQLPNIQGGDDDRHPLPEDKQRSVRKRLEARVQLAENQYADNGDIQGYCPFHEDAVASTKPSARFNPIYGYWYCFAPKPGMGCAERGKQANLDKMLRKLKGGASASNGRVRDIGSAPSKRKGKSVPEITERQALDFCNTLQMSPGMLEALELKRLWDKDTIATLGIGVIDGTFMSGLANKPRFTIPVYDAHGKYVACRIYDALGNRGNDEHKFFWSGGESGPAKDAILRPSRRKSLAPKVVIMEGEPDVILAQQDFRDSKAQIDFVSGTRGAKAAWPVKANDILLNRDVYICLDNDEEGANSSQRLLQVLKTNSKVQNIYVMQIPQRKGVKDWTDFRRGVVKSASKARQAMVALMDDAEHVYSRTEAEAEASRRAEPPGEEALGAVRVDDAATIAPGSRGAIADVHVLGRANNTFFLQTDIKLACERDKGNKCDKCPLGEAWEGQEYGEKQLTYFPHEPEIIAMADASDEQKRKVWRRDSGAKCPDFEIEIKDEIAAYPYLVEDKTPPAESTGSEPKQHVMFFVGTGDIDSTSIQRVAYNKVSYWKDSSAVLFTWGARDMGADLDHFVMPKASDRRLRKMMHDGKKVREKLDEIAEDFAWNVTHVFGRPMLHTLVDLVYHSVLWMPFENQPGMKGWLDVMVMGDSHTGKSATTRKMGKFYGEGGTVNGGSTSRAGLLAGMSSSVTNSKFMFPKKGALPRNHRGILTIEESHKLALRRNDGIIAQMADARDNGFFNLAMIGEITAPAATRLLWIANPPGDMSRSRLDEFPYGAADAISMMMGGRENVTRFTMAIGVGSDEVSKEDTEPQERYSRSPRFTGKQQTLRHLMTWAWSRKPEHIEWGDGAEELVRSLAAEMSGRYSDDFPIAMGQDLYAKVARVAAAIAARVYSSPDGVRLVVQKKHVRAAARFMKELYASEALGMQQMAQTGIRMERARETNQDELVRKLWEKQAYGLCHMIIDNGEFDPMTLAGSTGMPPFEVQEIMALLSQGAFIRVSGRRHWATPTLNQVAQKALDMMDETVKSSSKTVKNKDKSRRGPIQPLKVK